MKTHARGRHVAAVVAAVLLVAGVTSCDSSDGSPAAPEPVVDVSTLDVGNYSTEIRDIGLVANQDQARFIEAERLGDYVPTPADIDPRFVTANPSIATVFLDPEASLGKIMEVGKFREVAPDFIGGFVSTGGTDKGNLGIDLVNAVMLFPDSAKATAAAAALERSDAEFNTRNEPIEIPGYPAAKAHWQPQEQSIGSWYATGNLVIYTWIYDYLKIWLEKVDKQALLDLTKKSLDTVVPALAQFRPTPVDQLMTLPRDRDGMLGRTLKRPTEDSWLNPPGVYNGRTARHFVSNPIELGTMIADKGIDLYATDGTDIYRARDAEAARAVSTDMGGLSRKFTRSASPKNLPSALCKEYIGREKVAIRFYCTVSHGRYAAYAWSHQLLDAQQRIAAQYVLFTKAK
ncbi:hypothetical protein ACFYTF_07225 [Nocardia thailandica]|uniref:Uncharacterized protein n=1 Tax=Nocardia thailandica TaxID=257275 RepID=A0ABW6PJT1_9NOCA